MKTGLNDKVVKIELITHLIYEVLRSYSANIKFSHLFVLIWSFETIHCVHFKRHRQKRHGVTNDVKVHFLICGYVGCMKNKPLLANIL